MRIAVALVVIADLLIRWPDIEAFYSDDGIWPRELADHLGWKGGYWSFHMLSGSVYWQLTLFSVHLLAAVSMFVGWRSVISTAVTWLLLVSLHNRNVYILQAGDDLLRMTLFFGIFLPWNAYFSVDSARKAYVMPTSVYVYLAYLLLVASVYFFTVILKSSSEWSSEGSAIYYALSLEQLRLPYTGDWLYKHPIVMRALTWLVVFLEASIPLLVLFPHKKNKTRIVAFFCILALHLGIASTLYVGLFPFIGVASAIGLLVFDAKEKTKFSTNFFERRTVKSEISWVAASAAAFCIIINLQGVPNFQYELRPILKVPAHVFRLDQYWGMFSPSVLKLDGWYVYQGIGKDGKEWDLREQQSTVNYDKPARILSHYKNDRWRKLAENLQNDNYTFLRPPFARYIFRKWNREHSEKPLQMLNLYYMEKTNLAGYRQSEIRKVLYCSTDGR
jgi:hypothetical protein